MVYFPRRIDYYVKYKYFPLFFQFRRKFGSYRKLRAASFRDFKSFTKICYQRKFHGTHWTTVGENQSILFFVCEDLGLIFYT